MTDPTEQDPIPDGPVFDEPEPVYVEPLRTPAPDDIPEPEAAASADANRIERWITVPAWSPMTFSMPSSNFVCT